MFPFNTMFSRIFCRKAAEATEEAQNNVPASGGEAPEEPNADEAAVIASRKRLRNDEEQEQVTENGEPPEKLSRFEIGEGLHGNAWELQEEQTIYLNKYLSKHLHMKDLKERVLDDYPAPANIKRVPELDSYIKELLQEGSKYDSLQFDKTLKGIQEYIHSVFGPVCTLWSWIEEERRDMMYKNLPDELEDPARLFDQTIVMLAQCFQEVSFQRRSAVLSKLISNPSVVKEILKNQSEKLNNPGNNLLFGPSFEEQLAKDSTARSKVKTVLNGLKKPQTSAAGSSRGGAVFPKRGFRGFPSGRRGRWPFRGGPRLQQTRGRGQSSGQRNNWKPSFRGGKKNFTKKFCFGLRSGEGSSSFATDFSSNASRTFRASREDQTLPKELGGVDPRYTNTRAGERFSDSSDRCSVPRRVASSISNEFGGEEFSGRGSPGDASERSHSGGLTCPGSVCELDILGGEKGCRASPCDKLKETEPIHPLSALQNGVFGPFAGPSGTRRFNGESRSQRRLLFSSFKNSVPKVCEVPVEGQVVSVSLPVLWPSSCTQDLYKTSQGTNSFAQEVEHQVSDLFGRHTIARSISGGDRDRQGLFDFRIAMSRFHYKSEKVCINTKAGDGVPGDSCGFRKDDAFSSREEKARDNFQMQVDHGNEGDFFKVSGQNSREIVLYCHSSASSSVASKSSPAVSNKDFNGHEQFREQDCSHRRNEGGTILVGREPSFKQREEVELSPSRPGNSNRRLKERMGCGLPWSKDRRPLVSLGEGHSYKHFGAQGCSSRNKDFCEDVPLNSISPSSDGQPNSSGIHSQTRRYSQSGAMSIEQGALGISVIQRDHGYSRVLARSDECGSRLRVSTCPGLKRMEASARDIPSSVSDIGISRDRSVCFESLSSSPKVLCLEARPLQCGKRCFSSEVDRSPGLCIPSILSYGTSVEKGRGGSGDSDIGSSGLAGSGMVPKTPSTSNKESNPPPLSEGLVVESKGRMSSTTSKQQSTISSVASVREIGFDFELSEGAANLIVSSRRQGTRSRYKSAWSKWTSWCDSKQIDPVRCSLAGVLNYLAELFNQGLQYNTIAGYRSAISAFHDPIDGIRVGSHPKVSTLMTGIFNERCPKPKFCFVWDVEIVLKFLKSLGNELSNKMLTLRVTMLLALSSACRAHKIKFLDRDYMVRTEDAFIFHFAAVTKNARPGKMKPPIEFVRFSQDSALCVHANLDLYLERCTSWGRSGGQLLVSHISPHGPVSSSTISRWLVEILKLSGIDVKNFKGHSTRSASTSKACSLGISKKEIMERAQWSRESTFQKFYFKPINKKAIGLFQKAVLNATS